jgi:hypothetical protein
MSNIPPSLAALAATPMTSQNESKKNYGSWFEAMAAAWGAALDRQAFTIEGLSAELEGNDTPAAITTLTAESMKMGFLSNSSHTSISAVGEALSTMARKS